MRPSLLNPSALCIFVLVRISLDVVDEAVVQQVSREPDLPGIRGRQRGRVRGQISSSSIVDKSSASRSSARFPQDKQEAMQNAGEISPKNWVTRSTAEPVLCWIQ